jgi:hypothetical protein
MKLFHLRLVYVGFVAAAACVFLQQGCGGGSEKVSTASTAGLSKVQLFLTDSFRDDYDQVWMGITRVELLTPAGVAETLYADASGIQINARELVDSTGRGLFRFLAGAEMSNVIFDRVRVTLRGGALLTPKNQFYSQSFGYASTLPKDGSGNVQYVFPLNPSRSFLDGSSLVIDIDLANFVLNGGQLTPSLKEGSQNGISDLARQQSTDFNGVVFGLIGTAPNQTFSISSSGQTYSVATSNVTSIYSFEGGDVPLSNGQVVSTRVRADASTTRLIATAIRVENSGVVVALPRVAGDVSAVDASLGVFTLTLTQADGFSPLQKAMRVQTSPSGLYYDAAGNSLKQNEFFIRIAKGGRVQITARRVDTNAAQIDAAFTRLE